MGYSGSIAGPLDLRYLAQHDGPQVHPRLAMPDHLPANQTYRGEAWHGAMLADAGPPAASRPGEGPRRAGGQSGEPGQT